ncbi:unnamed protein product [Rhizophagus irregularis]|nr:unnamed protein product [Rhizophagus irregularis]
MKRTNVHFICFLGYWTPRNLEEPGYRTPMNLKEPNLGIWVYGCMGVTGPQYQLWFLDIDISVLYSWMLDRWISASVSLGEFQNIHLRYEILVTSSLDLWTCKISISNFEL